MTTKRFIILLFIFVIPSFTWAYLDPGTGSLLVYALVGLLTSLGFAFRNIFYRLQGLFLGGGFKHKGVSSKIESDIVFHSEGSSYWHSFEPIIQACIRRKIKTTYITPDKNDPAFNLVCDFFTVINPGNPTMTIAWMNKIEAKLVVSTTPHLDIYMWKRSKKVNRYVHFFHAPDGVDFYEKYALSFYDDILITGKEQEKAIRFLDSQRGLPEKKYYPVGCTYYDFMLNEIKNVKPEYRTAFAPRVLYAPTWGERSSVLKYGTKFIDDLAQAGMPVIFRPHPQYAISHKKLLQELEQKYKDNNLVTIDYNRTPIQAMIDSDVLIADISGVVFDYAYLFNKPVILTGSTLARGGYEAEDADIHEWTVPALKELSTELTEQDLEDIPSFVSKVRTLQGETQRIENFRNKNLYNFGSAGEAAVDALLKIVQVIKNV